MPSTPGRCESSCCDGVSVELDLRHSPERGGPVTGGEGDFGPGHRVHTTTWVDQQWTNGAPVTSNVGTIKTGEKGRGGGRNR